MALNPEVLPGELTHGQLFAGVFSANANSSAFDLLDYKGKVAVVLNAAAATNDNQAANVTLVHSNDTNISNAIAFDPAITFTAIAANGGAQVQSAAVDTRVARRYLFAQLTRAAAGNGRAITLGVTGKAQATA